MPTVRQKPNCKEKVVLQCRSIMQITGKFIYKRKVRCNAKFPRYQDVKKST